MKIQIASDLHLEHQERRFPDYRIVEPTDADVLILAGDIHRDTRAIDVFQDWPVPVIYIHGNHELYDNHWTQAVDQLRTAAAGSNVHFLERNEYVLHGVRFLGCCLWTDYEVFNNKAEAMREAEHYVHDYRLIHTDDGLFTAGDSVRLHVEVRDWLQKKLDEPFAGPTVVVSHHGPHPNSIHARFAGSVVNAAFVSDLTPMLQKANLWIHGHVHDSFDYYVGDARVIANPRGYPRNLRSVQTPEQIEWENVLFNPKLVVEIEHKALV